MALTRITSGIFRPTDLANAGVGSNRIFVVVRLIPNTLPQVVRCAGPPGRRPDHVLGRTARTAPCYSSPRRGSNCFRSHATLPPWTRSFAAAARRLFCRIYTELCKTLWINRSEYTRKSPECRGFVMNCTNLQQSSQVTEITHTQPAFIRRFTGEEIGQRHLDCF